MVRIRKSSERAYIDHGWLKSFHSFSFASYYDPHWMSWGNLRVINEDRIAPQTGFGEHHHRDMEIISYVLSGELAHQDSMGNIKTIPPGDIQGMSAGTGVLHSEFNHANTETHFLQIWLTPKLMGVAPSYEQKSIPRHEKQGKLRLLASPDGMESSITINADAKLYAGLFERQQEAVLEIDPRRKAYVHLIRGTLTVNQQQLQDGDALVIADTAAITISGGEQAEVLVFDLLAKNTEA